MLHKCSKEQHDKCENSSLCHLCDGIRLYKNSQEERARKLKQREINKQEQRNAAFRVHKDEKKEGMAFEKAVTKKWNNAFNQSIKNDETFKQVAKKTKIQKPRFEIEKPQEKTDDEVQSISPSITLSTLGPKTPPNRKEVVDAKRQANSGALWYAKGDIKTQDYLMECKERGTVNARGEKTITIPKEWLTKQEIEAFQENRPYWVIPFRYKNDESIYLVKSFDQEIEMYQEMRKLREEVATLKELIS